ncbi:MAG: hypothetical protein FJX78_04435 [Armatimonadetes bacterium]|nr:hypothetical protein [Armatimonadota bacterium]
MNNTRADRTPLWGRRLGTAALALALLAAGAPTGAPAAPAPADRFVFALQGGPDTLDPQMTVATPSFQANKSLYDTLVEPDDQGRITPALAESWTVSNDGLTYTFRLRAGVKFHHGKILDAGDVKATFERILDSATRSPRRSDYATIKSVDAVDPLTVRFTLSERFSPFLANLGQGWGAILPADLIGRRHDFGTRPVGTGPFTVAEWQRDSFIRFQRFGDYFQRGAPRLREVTIRFVADPAVRVAGLLSGEFDAIDTVPATDVARVRQNSNVVVLKQVTSLVNVVSINNSRGPLQDVRVRRAIWHSIDRREVLKTSYGEDSVPGHVFMDVTSPYFLEIPDPYPYNPDRARQLLAEAGHARGITVDLPLPQIFNQHIQAGQLVQAMLARSGITARPRVVEWGFWLSNVFRGGEFDLTVIGHTGRLDPDSRLNGYGEPTTNYVRYQNQRVIDLLGAGRITARPDLRKRIYDQILRQMTDDAMLLVLGTPVLYAGTRANVRNFRQLYAIDTYDFRSTTK